MADWRWLGVMCGDTSNDENVGGVWESALGNVFSRCAEGSVSECMWCCVGLEWKVEGCVRGSESR